MVEEFVILERLVVCCGGGEYISGQGRGEREREETEAGKHETEVGSEGGVSAGRRQGGGGERE